MPPLPAVNTFISVDEYINGELHSEIRHEYVDGQVYAMGGASDSHGLIVNALAFALTPAARQKHCQLFTSDMKLRLNIADKTVFYYPDLLLSCAPDDRQPYFRRPALPDCRGALRLDGTHRPPREAVGLPDLAELAGVSAGRAERQAGRGLSADERLEGGILRCGRDSA